MKNILMFTVFIIMASIIKVNKKDYDSLQAEHDNCYRVKPHTTTGNIPDTNYFVVIYRSKPNNK